MDERIVVVRSWSVIAVLEVRFCHAVQLLQLTEVSCKKHMNRMNRSGGGGGWVNVPNRFYRMTGTIGDTAGVGTTIRTYPEKTKEKWCTDVKTWASLDKSVQINACLCKILRVRRVYTYYRLSPLKRYMGDDGVVSGQDYKKSTKRPKPTTKH